MTTMGDTSTVWDGLVGQHAVIERLQRAVAGDMSHAWLFTGPPGSGRSNAAIAFAAGLQCEQGGCGRCHSCHEIAVGSHPDVRITRTEKLSIGVDEVRDLVRSSALAPVGNRWQVMVVEDADRLTDQAAQRAPQGDRGADRAHGVAALRADGRGRPVDDPLPHPAGRTRHPVRRGRDRLPGAHRGARRRDRVVRRPRQPGSHRPGPGAGSRRGHPAPPPRGGRHPGAADLPGRVHVRRRRPARPRQGGGRGTHHRARPAREGRPRPRLRGGRARTAARGSTPRPSATWRSPRRRGPSDATSTSSTAG